MGHISRCRRFPPYFLYHKVLADNTVQNFEIYSESNHKWLEFNIYPSVNGLSVYFKDVTERKLSNIKLLQLNESLQNYTKELVSANKELEQFSYIVSHNLRAPVATITGLANILNQDDSPPELKKKCLEGLHLNAQRLDNVIKDLNSILQVKKDIAEKKEVVNLAQLVFNIEASIEGLIQKEGVQINTDFKAAPEFFTLKSYLHSIFYNLISNSIKYRRPDLPLNIQIKSEIVEDELIISFKDNGLGIDLAKKKDQVFGLYKRFHLHIEGKGMGLFMVKTQVQTLGGEISISSEINNGTEFKIKFKNN